MIKENIFTEVKIRKHKETFLKSMKRVWEIPGENETVENTERCEGQ